MASSAWERRNASARAAGYRNYYDYRAHDYGRLPASAERLTGEPLARARGHRSIADLERLVAGGRVEIATVIPAGDPDPKTGRYKSVEVVVIDSNGRERRFVMKGQQASSANMGRIKDSFVTGGVLYLDSPSIDVGDDDSAADEPELDWDELDDVGDSDIPF